MKNWKDTIEDLFTSLSTIDTDLDVFTGYAPVGAQCPYLAIIPGGMEPATADDGAWFIKRAMTLEFYSYETMDFDLEVAIAQKLIELGYIFTSDEPAYDQDGMFYLTVFNFEVSISIDQEES